MLSATGGSQDIADKFESNFDRVIDKFEDMGLKQELLYGIYAYGFGTPLSIQQRAIVPIIKGHDVVVTAPVGAGKSATFIIPILQRLNLSNKRAQALILTDARQVAGIIQRDVVVFGNYNVECYACVNATSIHEDIAKLPGVQVVVGTPGRVWDLIQRRALSTNNITICCLYDAKILFHGSRDQVVNIFRLLPLGAQAVLYSSSTIPADILEMARILIPRSLPRLITLPEKVTFQNVKQFYVPIEKEGKKLDALCNLRDMMITNQAAVYCNSRHGADQLATAMRQRGIAVAVVHEKVVRRQCAASITGFLSGVSRILIITDHLSPSIDVHQISLVINYDLPRTKEYIQRIGSDGSLGHKRLAINFVTKKEIDRLREIEKFYNTKIGELPTITSNNVAEFIERIRDHSPEPPTENSSKTPYENTAGTSRQLWDCMGHDAQSKSTTLATLQAENISLRFRIDWLINRIDEQVQRADQARCQAEQTRRQLEFLRSEGHKERYRPLGSASEETLPHKPAREL